MNRDSISYEDEEERKITHKTLIGRETPIKGQYYVTDKHSRHMTVSEPTCHWQQQLKPESNFGCFAVFIKPKLHDHRAAIHLGIKLAATVCKLWEGKFA
jgi:hypothetical protein